MKQLLEVLLIWLISGSATYCISICNRKLQHNSKNLRLYGLPQLTETEWKSVSTVGLISAPLGTLLDDYHGLFDVLNYNPEVSAISFALPGSNALFLKTSAWTPFLFFYAGAVMATILFVTETLLSSKLKAQSWPRILYGISLFSFQYYLSGLLDSNHVPVAIVHASLAILTVVGMLLGEFFTIPGIVLSLSTAIAGPLAEVILTSFHLYSYTNADFNGVCSWIPWVYLLGGPAVGNLALKIREEYNAREFEQK